jgi:hypothetical protein
MKCGMSVNWDGNSQQTYELIYLYSNRALIVRMSSDGFPVIHDVLLSQLKAKAGTK